MSSRSLVPAPALAFVATVLLAAAPTASAQQQVDQRANQQVNQQANIGPRGLPPARRSSNAAIAARNSVVTNNVVSGRGFRGSTGYTGTYDFRGDLGSEEIRGFLSRSQLTTSGAFRRGDATSRLQYGLALGEVEYVPRGTALPLRNPALPSIDTRLTATGADRLLAFDDGVVRDAARLEPVAVGSMVDQSGNRRPLEATPVQGVRAGETSVEAAATRGLTALDELYLREALLRDPTRTTETDLGDLLAPAEPGATGSLEEQLAGRAAEEAAARAERMARARGLVDTRSNVTAAPRATLITPGRLEGETAGPRPAARPGEDSVEVEIARRVAERYARLQGRGDVEVEMEPSLLEKLDAEIERIRELLAPPTPPGQSPGMPGAPGAPGAGDNQGAGEGGESVEPLRTPDVSGLGSLLRHGAEVERLTAGQPDDRAADLMRDAEADLLEGRYFRAERGFRRSLQLVPGQPMAFAGLIHAQIGAGLQLPAATGLRRVFSLRPEVIGIEWGDRAKPPVERLERVLEETRARLVDDPNVGSIGLVHAYVGRLLDRREAIERGLEAMRTADPRDPLPNLLAEAWLAGGDD